MRFPLGGLRKPEVRELARAAGLPVADKRESQDLCFLAGTGKRAFLERHGGPRARRGPIVDLEGRRVGEHDGQHLFTVGQRKGLGVAGDGARSSSSARTRRPTRSSIGPRAALATDACRVRDAVLHRPSGEVDRVKLRYRTAPLRLPRGGRRGRAGCGWRSTSPSRAPRRARSPACCAATSSSGTASSPDPVVWGACGGTNCGWVGERVDRSWRAW